MNNEPVYFLILLAILIAALSNKIHSDNNHKEILDTIAEVCKQ